MKYLLLIPFLILGCAGPQRTTHTTLHAIGKSVDIAEREYLHGVLSSRYPTNRFPETQLAYGIFQVAYSNAVWHASRSTNAIGIPEDVRLKALDAMHEIDKAKGAK